MEHPPKQGLKLVARTAKCFSVFGFNGTSTKTRIETNWRELTEAVNKIVLMEHPPKQGLKPKIGKWNYAKRECFNGTSTKTRIETKSGRYFLG